MAEPLNREGGFTVVGFEVLSAVVEKKIIPDTTPYEDGFDNQPTILTAGERRVLLWCGNGKTSFEISRILGLSEHTVNHYIASAVRKLDAANRTHAIAKALKMNFVDISDIN